MNLQQIDFLVSSIHICNSNFMIVIAHIKVHQHGGNKIFSIKMLNIVDNHHILSRDLKGNVFDIPNLLKTL